MRVALVVEYDGADYHGFQYQLNAPSIQREMEKAIKLMTGESVRIKGAGRNPRSRPDKRAGECRP